MYWPVTQFVAGLAVFPVIAARFAGAAAPAGVNVPGVPAVAPVATTTGFIAKAPAAFQLPEIFGAWRLASILASRYARPDQA